MSIKTALIFGVNGQDGSYLARHLCDLGYIVYGAVKRKLDNYDNLNFFELLSFNNFKLSQIDITKKTQIRSFLKSNHIDEIYNLAAQSSSILSLSYPALTAEITAFGALNILNEIHEASKNIKYFQASSSEIFCKSANTIINENSIYNPTTPYGTSKLFAHLYTKSYRDNYNLFACNGILFNHESPLRTSNFVTQQIVQSVISFKNKLIPYIEIGNLDSKKDWGFAGDYVKAMHLILQNNKPDDFVIATGKLFSVRDLVIYSFKKIGIEIIFKGTGLHEVGYNKENGEKILIVNKQFYREDNSFICGDCKKINKLLHWSSKKDIFGVLDLMFKFEDRKKT